ncbi:hypothetical protein CMV_024104 [Castanea mollissima]|uniref:Neutral/alkaline non-lysosomal ceramidase N-terminal domain-containing protein n=1 Tax=Castanea mollissima TaxID=60419 RepID=A0A8J4QNM1_9ROSI|nr:hypothetical protein CMV_024104 [Castanea mollissima]
MLSIMWEMRFWAIACFAKCGGVACECQGFKVRKNNGLPFAGAFCQSNVGDVTPNVLGAFCIDSGKPCDFNHSSCHGNDQLCMGRGPGYPNEILSTQIIGERQYQKAVDLFVSATEELTGKIDYRRVYLNFTDIEVELDGNNVVKTCPAALGPGFAAGTTDGPGAFGFQQGDTKVMIVFYSLLLNVRCSNFVNFLSGWPDGPKEFFWALWGPISCLQAN